MSNVSVGDQKLSEELLELPVRNLMRVCSNILMILVVSYIATGLLFYFGSSFGALIFTILWEFVLVPSRQPYLCFISSSRSIGKFSPCLLVSIFH